MHKLFKDRLFVIENGPGDVRWYTNGHFALSANVVAKARHTKGVKFLQELPAMRAGVYRDGEFDATGQPPSIENILPKVTGAKVRATGLTITSWGKQAETVYVIGANVVAVVNPDYAALLDLAEVLEGDDGQSPIVGRLSEGGPIEILVMPMRNGEISCDGDTIKIKAA